MKKLEELINQRFSILNFLSLSLISHLPLFLITISDSMRKTFS